MKINRGLIQARQDYQSFQIESESAESRALQEVDVAKIQLKLLIESSFSDLKKINPAIREALANLRQQGFIFLDASVAETLLASPELIPEHWKPLADSDAPGPFDGDIRFDGTVFRNKASGERSVVTPFVARGRWGFGWSDWEYSRASLDAMKKHGGSGLIRLYTAVL